MILEKRGLSAVIATVLLILLTIAAVSIFAAFILPWVKDNLSSSTACSSYQDYFKFDETFDYSRCYVLNADNSLKQYIISIKASQDIESDDVDGFVLAFNKPAAGGTESVTVKTDGTVTSPNFKMYDLTSLKIPSKGNIMTYRYQVEATTSSSFDSATIAPILKTKTCPTSDAFKEIDVECVKDSNDKPEFKQYT